MTTFNPGWIPLIQQSLRKRFAQLTATGKIQSAQLTGVVPLLDGGGKVAVADLPPEAISADLSNYFDTDLIDLLLDPATTQLQFDTYVTANGFASGSFLWLTEANISLIAANTTAMNALVGEGISFLPGFAASTTAMNILAASTTAMNILAASSTAMNILAASTAAMNILAASTTVMNILAASTTALSATFGTLIGRKAFWTYQVASDILLSTAHSFNWMLSNVSTTLSVDVANNTWSTTIFGTGKVFVLQSSTSSFNYRFRYTRDGAETENYSNSDGLVDTPLALGRSEWTTGTLPSMRNNSASTRTLTAVFVNMEAF